MLLLHEKIEGQLKKDYLNGNRELFSSFSVMQTLTNGEHYKPDNKSGSHEDIQEFPAEEQPADQNMQQTAQNPPIEHKHVKPLPVEYAYTEGYDEPETVFINEF